jgi:hypothetical protein
MADRYQDRPFPADDGVDRGDDDRTPGGESDPLAELARLIGQTDPFAMGRANAKVQPRSGEREQYEPPPPLDEPAPAGPPPWMQRNLVQEAPPQDVPNAVHPLRRYAAPLAAPEPEYPEPPPADYDPDPARYDEALYGQLGSGEHEEPARDPAYPDDPYAYQDGYDEEPEQPVRRRGGLITIVAVLALAVIGTGAALAYRTYMGSPRSGEPPIIRADSGPTKVVPAPADASSKVPDRMAAGDSGEKIVPREEAPVDVNARSGARVVLPPLNPNPNPPPLASVTTSGPPQPGSGNGTLPNNEPRKIKTFSVRGDQPDAAAVPVAAPPPIAARPASAASRNPPSAANASANGPLSLSPQAAAPATTPAAPEPRTRVAATTPPASSPVQIAPAASGGAGGGGYMVQVSSQRNEADAQASYRALQNKFPAVLGSRAPVVKRADLADKGVYYRAMVGPYDSPDEAKKLCGDLKAAGGQCNVVKY